MSIDRSELRRRWAPTLHVEASRSAELHAPVLEQVGDRQPTVEAPPPAPEETVPASAFITTHNNRTLISAPAATIKAAGETSHLPSLQEIAANHLLYMRGRFVGAEEANRNGALWSAGDLELAHGTVLYGPLNWLHEARHVIGTLTQAEYIDPARAEQTADAAEATGPVKPHITATSAIWRWIWPDEAYVVQQASDWGKLWYSMECISREVACAGPNGCGNTTSYEQYIAGAACEHVTQRASVRRFVDPVFLGGAVIVPPSRPGWADADARVMATAGRLAESAYDQAGRPDVRANEWEQIMAQVVRYAEGDKPSAM